VTVNTDYGVIPAPVPSLSVPATSSTGSVTVSWSAATPVTGYVLQESSNGGSSWSTVYSGTSTSAARTGLGNGSYTYRVQACNTAGGGAACAAWATGGPLVVTHPPASAPSLSAPAASSTGSYTVSWGSVSTATSYTLQESVNGGSWTTAYSGSAQSKAISGKGNGTYAYRVEACNAGGCSAWSGSKNTVVTHPPASAPSLSVPATSSTGSYTVSWGSVSTATSYTLQESSNGGSSWSTAYSGSAQSKALSGKGDGTYTYRVEACNAGGCGPWSATHAIAVALIPVMPAHPLTLTVTGPTTKPVIHVTWSAVAEATSYSLQMEEPAVGTSWTTVNGVSGTTWSQLFLYSGAVDFRLQACNSHGCSAWSSAQGVTVQGGDGGLLAAPEANPAEAGSTASPAVAASTGAQP
jgi:predicted phage tail protein